MTDRVKNILRGAGSIMDISPGTNYKKFVPEKNMVQRMNGHWTRVGKNIQTAITRLSNDQQTKK